MFDQIPVELKEVSRQLWAFLGPLVANDSNKSSTFKNVVRHNGFEAWRQIALPIHEDKILILQELLPSISNPKSAADIHHYDDALRDWNTNLRCSMRLEASDRQVPPRDWRSPSCSRLTSRHTSPCTWTSRSTESSRS